MAAARNYRRQLLMLYQEDAGFGSEPGKKPAGFLKLEIKGGMGLLTSLVQNLRDIKDEGMVYKGFIGASEGPVFVVTGTIPVDGRGRGESAWRFDPDNVGGTGYDIDRFDVFGVMALRPGDRSLGIVLPLSGHIGKPKRDWKELLRKSLAGDADGTTRENREPDKTPEKDAPAAADAKAAERPAGHPETAEVVHKLKHEDMTAKPGTLESRQAAEVLGESETSPGLQQIGPEALKHSGLERIIEEALSLYPRVQPFEQPERDCRWWRINSYNYLFGVKYRRNGGIGYYIYGIPGIYHTQAQMQMEAYGFLGWRPLKGEGRTPGDSGYWLAYVDAKTGVLANPAELGG